MFLKRRKHKAVAAASSSQPPPLQVNEYHHGNLKPIQLDPKLTSHYGVPSTASSLCYDPVQRVLAVCTLDGRIKLFGRDGMEGLLQSDQRLPCKFVEFVINHGEIINITLQNDIQIWDLQDGKLGHSHRWHAEITAFAVIQGSPFMYVGEDSGDVAVLHYSRKGNKLLQMPYYVPVLGGMHAASSGNRPSVVGILPCPDAEFSRVVILYGNGIIILWGLKESRVLAVRGVTTTEWEKLTGSSRTLSDEDGNAVNLENGQEKDICCSCWTSSAGSLLAVGYTDGDIYLWSFPTISKGQPNETLNVTDVPMLKLQTSTGKNRAAVVVLRWSTDRKGDSGESGLLHVFGGGDLGHPNILTIFYLKWTDAIFEDSKIPHLVLQLHGVFDDMILLPTVGSRFSDPAAVLLVLTSAGQLHAYDEASISKFFSEYQENMAIPQYLQPILLQWPFVDPAITVARLVSLIDTKSLEIFFKIFTHPSSQSRGIAPSSLPSGTKWPVAGGAPKMISPREAIPRMIYMSGHNDGSVNIWDASLPILSHCCSLQRKFKAEWGTASVSALEFCPSTNILVIGDEQGVVHLYTLNAEAAEVHCIIVNKSTIEEQVVFADPGFQCKAIFDIHQAPISSVTISSVAAHVAFGCTNGWISIIETNTCSVLFHGCCFANNDSGIACLEFAHASSSSKCVSNSPESQQPPQVQSSGEVVLYAAAHDATVVALSGETGVIIGSSWHSGHPDKAVSLHLFDGEDATSSYLLFCTRSFLHLFSRLTFLQVASISLETGNFQLPCCWASTFASHNTHLDGVVLVNKDQILQIRSLPDLTLVKEIPLNECLNWDLELGETFSRTLTCALNGQMALINRDKELLFFSLLDYENGPRILSSTLKFFDEDIAAAANAVFKAVAYPTKRKSQIQGLLGSVLKDLTGGVLKATTSGKEQPEELNLVSELSNIFEACSFPVSTATQHLDSHSEEMNIDNLELRIDDIHIEDEVNIGTSITPGSPSGSKLTKLVSGKEKDMNISEDRAKLLGQEDNGKMPKRRTAEDIKAAYGHRKTGDFSGAAGHARDKLLERQEKLQALSKRTEEMQEGAKNFASVATDLAKAMEERKWWQL